MNFLEEQGKLLKEFRFKNGISLQKLSDKTGVAKSTLIALEAGKSKPQATTIFKLREYISKFE